MAPDNGEEHAGAKQQLGRRARLRRSLNWLIVILGFMAIISTVGLYLYDLATSSTYMPLWGRVATALVTFAWSWAIVRLGGWIALKYIKD